MRDAVLITLKTSATVCSVRIAGFLSIACYILWTRYCILLAALHRQKATAPGREMIEERDRLSAEMSKHFANVRTESVLDPQNIIVCDFFGPTKA